MFLGIKDIIFPWVVGVQGYAVASQIHMQRLSLLIAYGILLQSHQQEINQK